MGSSTPDIPAVRPDGLQLDEPRSLQRAVWRLERIGWGAFLALILAAGLGLTGSGGLLARAGWQGDGVSIEYPQITRWQAADELRLQIAGDAADPQVTVANALLEAFEIVNVVPAPAEEAAEPGQVVLTFTGSGGEIVFDLRGRQPGLYRYAITVGDGEPAELATLILP